MDLLLRLLDAQITFGDTHILWREVIGNLYGLASAVARSRPPQRGRAQSMLRQEPK
jgi:nicotinamide mononucleotide transporter